MGGFRYGVGDVAVDSLVKDSVKEPVKERPIPRPVPALSAVALVALLLVGCTGPEPATDPGTTAEAAPSPSVSAAESSPAPSPTPVVVAPERPAAMDDDGYEGAEAAAVYFLSLDDYIMKTGDTTEWEAMSHPECSTCSKRLEQAQHIAQNGDTFTGGEMSANILHTYEQDEATGIWPLDIKVSVEPVVITDQAGDQVFADDAVEAEQRFEVLRQRDQWVIVNIVGSQHIDGDDA
ncbi:hypothetical protein GCM10009718_21840 [Isoptericola halotolerans]|uniref:DUF6318 domain-containing protein n=1 Tax=Isoptericola halotolerans TaxID=300560 RepID=A0ABX2AA16_9MICO|nr:DUF6318 family protein [Isoptericola halotolerans]NOV98882.1 hypothetical protein [Isoptericola halotolerans]